MNVWEAILAVTVLVSSLVIAGVPTLLKLGQPAGTPETTVTLLSVSVRSSTLALVLVGAFAVHFGATWARRLLPGFARHKEVRERKVATAQTITELTLVCCELESAEALGGHQKIRRDILDTMVSHTSNQLRDRNPGKFVASLLLYDKPSHSFTVVERSSRSGRPVGKNYQANSLFCLGALTQKKTISVGDIRSIMPGGSNDLPYRDILAVPLLALRSGSDDIGVVTIDCESSFIFDDREETLAFGLGPYVGLLKLSLHVESNKSGR